MDDSPLYDSALQLSIVCLAVTIVQAVLGTIYLHMQGLGDVMMEVVQTITPVEDFIERPTTTFR